MNMRKSLKRFFLSLALLSGTITLLWATTLPPKPSGYVVDESQKLSPSETQDLEEVLDAFARAKGHRVYVWLLGKKPEANLHELAQQALESWGTPSGDKGEFGSAVLAIDLSQKITALKANSPLNEALPESEIQKLQSRLESELRQNPSASGIRADAVAVLNAIIGPQTPIKPPNNIANLKFLFIFLGVIAGSVILIILLGGELTITSGGKKVYYRKFSGKYADVTTSFISTLLAGIGLGGLGGFRGGGGKFGGGGASGSW